MADQPEDFSSLSIPDRFAHKNWKARKDGYESARKQFEVSPDEEDPAFRPFLQDSGIWKGAVADSNVAAQQEGLAAYCAFLKFGGAQACSRSQNTTIGPIIEKGLASTRPAAKNSAREALLLIIEIDRSDSVLEALIGALSHKQPKIIAATLSTLSLVYHSYGCKIVDSKPTLRSLPKVFGHADKNVRAEAQSLTVELYRWLKEAAKVLFWSELKPVQQQDLEKLFENVKQEPPPKQERFTRAQQEAMAVASEQPDAGDGDGGAGGGQLGEVEDDEADGEIDPFDLADPIDVLGKLPSGLYESLASSKWKDRKDALDELYKVCNVTKIKDGSFDELLRALAKCMKDANVAVVTVAANTIQAIAMGLRKSFGKHRSTVMPPMMERLKEKKVTVSEALGHALDAVFESTSLSECLEDILEFLKHKNPQVKLESVKFLSRCLRNTRDVPSKPEVKSLAEAATKLLTESSEVTRTGACEVFGVLMKIMGERPMNPYMDGLDDIRKSKIKEFYSSAEVKAKDRPKPIIGPPKTSAAPGGGKKPLGGKRPMGMGGAGKKLAPPVEAPMEPPTPGKKISKGVPKIGGVPKSSGIATPGSAMKMQRKIPGPGGAAASPQRRVVSPTESVPPPPKFGIGRGLTGRPIGKTSTLNQEPAQQMHPPTGLSAIERAELEELRADKDRLAKLTDDLRAERSKLISEINELQNQNAQLIEDHTRDVLSVKAKETQLVRARSDAEAAEQNVQNQKNQIERLKRELSRALRAGTANSPTSSNIPDMPLSMGYGDSGIYQDDMNNNHSSRTTAGRYMDMNSSRFETGSNSSSTTARHKLVSPSPSEEKENTNVYASPGLGGDRFPNRTKRVSPPAASAYSSGRGSPIRSSRTGMGASDSVSSTSEPAENWKRAAEVTSQLKARIEQMKARQGLSRHPPH